MSSDEPTGLRAHYERKYAADAHAVDARIVYPSARPVDRYEACVSFFLPRFRGGRILELGAGSGIVARSLVAAGLTCDGYTMTDISEARLEGLRRAFSDPRFTATWIDADALPDDPPAAYDAILMIALVEHLVDPVRALQRIRKMLRPGGFVYIDTPNIAKITRRLKLLFGRFPATASRDEGLTTYEGKATDLHDEGHLHYFTYRSLTRLLRERCGFAQVEHLGYHIGPSYLGARADNLLARWRPQLFSELVLVAGVT